ncbi:MAG: YciI family protein [Nocardiaceae bacterium]|nr:YciI family protein [Nocardiaceae bacterium]
MAIFAVQYTYTEATIPARDTHRPAHRSYLRDLANEGAVLSSGAYPDGSGALLLFRAESDEAMRELVDKDPFVSENLVERVEIKEWLPVIGTFSE